MRSTTNNHRPHWPLNPVDYRAIIRVLDDQESPLAPDERVALEKLKRIMERIERPKVARGVAG